MPVILPEYIRYLLVKQLTLLNNRMLNSMCNQPECQTLTRNRAVFTSLGWNDNNVTTHFNATNPHLTFLITHNQKKYVVCLLIRRKNLNHSFLITFYCQQAYRWYCLLPDFMDHCGWLTFCSLLYGSNINISSKHIYTIGMYLLIEKIHSILR